MAVEGPKEMIDWGRIRMPEIIIECDSVIITDSDGDKFDNPFINPEQNEISLLSCKSNKDDTDSGIHESNYILVTGLHSSLHSNRRSLREMKRKPKLSEIRSYSTNNLSEHLPRFLDDFEILNQSLCRNCSMKANGRKEREKITIIDKKIEVQKEVPKQPMVVKGNHSFQQRVCRISILLICMKILLGSTMTGLGYFLWSISISITTKDCAFWASAPLLLSGLIDIYYCKSSRASKRRRKPNYTITVICGVVSLLCSVICLLSSIFSGIHGNWISGHSDNCYSDDNDNPPGIQSACCYDNSTNVTKLCVCREPMKDVYSVPIISKTYDSLVCRYVFSAVKDYLILQCALMAVGAGVALWWVQILFQRIINQCSPMRRMTVEEQELEDENNDCVRQSPVVPLKLRCTIPSERFQISNDSVRNKMVADKSMFLDNPKYSDKSWINNRVN